MGPALEDLSVQEEDPSSKKLDHQTSEEGLRAVMDAFMSRRLSFEDISGQEGTTTEQQKKEDDRVEDPRKWDPLSTRKDSNTEDFREVIKFRLGRLYEKDSLERDKKKELFAIMDVINQQASSLQHECAKDYLETIRRSTK